MTKRTLLILFGAAFLLSAAPVVSGASQPGTAQTSSTPAKKKKRVSSRSKRRPKGQAAPTADRIKEIQAALQKDGSYQGQPTGKWDAATTEAMKKYQDKNGFSATGKIDALSLHKLGLGSETAGKGAPIPPATSAAPPADPPAKP
jgi:peptidoglycan hydrolase-like protein with peptidoglycan-binding domain